MAKMGIAPEEIDYVMCTHLHVDHAGWNTRLVDGRWVPTFPNAKYIFAERELNYWTEVYEQDPDKAAWMGDSVLPIIDAKKAHQDTTMRNSKVRSLGRDGLA